MTSYSQKMTSIESSNTVEKAAKKVVNELSKVIEVSKYQQESTVKILAKVAKERQNIENSVQGASQKTEALQSLKEKEEYSLRSMLNDQQYQMLLSILEKD